MQLGEQTRNMAASGSRLRTELSLRGLQFASTHSLLHERTDGQTPSIIFGQNIDGHHGNFHPLSYQRICANAEWSKRLSKVHTVSKRVRVRSDWQWKELDCACSSDALLMNIFCHPEALASAATRALLGVDPETSPQFGFKPRTPLQGSRKDNTEIDMKFGNLLVEAKLTEADFQTARPNLLTRYRDFEDVFELADLPLRNERHSGYQLIRGALAAYALDSSFCVLCDGRRPDLIEDWFRILRAVKPFELRSRLKVLTWQELAATLPDDLRCFLTIKYGIFAAA
jgi:hypothetical protein